VIAAVDLEQMKTGERATISALVGTDQELARLSALGLRGGVSIEMVRPGRTCIVQLEQTRLCLRPNRQTKIYVSPE
jgi:Fe2+ transport system protein FeoA